MSLKAQADAYRRAFEAVLRQASWRLSGAPAPDWCNGLGEASGQSRRKGAIVRARTIPATSSVCPRVSMVVLWL